MVEGARLESVYRGNSTEGSNPSLRQKKSQRCTHAVDNSPLSAEYSGSARNYLSPSVFAARRVLICVHTADGPGD